MHNRVCTVVLVTERPISRRKRQELEITRLRAENTRLRNMLRSLGHMAIHIADDTKTPEHP